eukprot:m.56922 g.56922  ORF g.56922 m.56922 type:complete len:1527 (+) comp7044_c0_seq1:129-4709(+)
MPRFVRKTKLALPHIHSARELAVSPAAAAWAAGMPPTTPSDDAAIAARRFVKAWQATFLLLDATRAYIDPIVRKAHSNVVTRVDPTLRTQCACGSRNFADFGLANNGVKIGARPPVRINGCTGNRIRRELHVAPCSKCSTKPPDECEHGLLASAPRQTTGGTTCHCEAWAAALVPLRAPHHGLSWQNSDPMLWQSDPWEMAKLFMPQITQFDVVDDCPGEHALEKHAAADFDITCLFNMMRNMTCFPGPSTFTSSLQEVINARNRQLGHSSDFALKRDEFKALFAAYSAWLQLPELASSESADALARIQHLEPDTAPPEPIQSDDLFRSRLAAELKTCIEQLPARLADTVNLALQPLAAVVHEDGETTRALLRDLMNDMARSVSAATDAATAAATAATNVATAMSTPAISDPSELPLPLSRVRNFCGREELLQQLLVNAASATPQPVVLHGVGGIGKTATLVEFAHRAKQQLPDLRMLWLSADPAFVEGSILTLAAALGINTTSNNMTFLLHQVAARLREWQQQQISVLFLVDNFDEPSKVPPALLKLLEIATQELQLGMVVTTRYALHQWKSDPHLRGIKLSDDHFILLDRLTQAASRDVLQQGLDGAACKDHEGLASVAKELDGLPLALQQALGFVLATECTFAEFHELFQQEKTKLLDSEYPAPGPVLEIDHMRLAVYTTWKMQLDALEKHRGMKTIITALVQLPCELIPIDILCPALHTSLSPAGTKLALERLKRFCLFLPNADGLTLRIHRLVQEVVRDDLLSENIAVSLQHVAKGMASALATVIGCSPSTVDLTTIADLPLGRLQRWHTLCAASAGTVTVAEDLAKVSHTDARHLVVPELAAVLRHVAIFCALFNRVSEALLYQEMSIQFLAALGDESLSPWSPVIPVPWSARSKILSCLNNYQFEHERAGLPPRGESSLPMHKQVFREQHNCWVSEPENVYHARKQLLIGLRVLDRALSDPSVAELDGFTILRTQSDVDRILPLSSAHLVILDPTIHLSFPWPMTSLCVVGIVKDGMKATIQLPFPCGCIIAHGVTLTNELNLTAFLVLLSHVTCIRLTDKHYPSAQFAAGELWDCDFKRGGLMVTTNLSNEPQKVLERPEQPLSCFRCTFDSCNVGIDLIDNAWVYCEDCSMSDGPIGVQTIVRYEVEPMFRAHFVRCEVSRNLVHGFACNLSPPESTRLSLFYFLALLTRKACRPFVHLKLEHCHIAHNGMFGIDANYGGKIELHECVIEGNRLWGVNCHSQAGIYICGGRINSNAGGVIFGGDCQPSQIFGTKIFQHRLAAVNSVAASSSNSQEQPFWAFPDDSWLEHLEYENFDNCRSAYAEPTTSVLQSLCPCGQCEPARCLSCYLLIPACQRSHDKHCSSLQDLLSVTINFHDGDQYGSSTTSATHKVPSSAFSPTRGPDGHSTQLGRPDAPRPQKNGVFIFKAQWLFKGANPLALVKSFVSLYDETRALSREFATSSAPALSRLADLILGVGDLCSTQFCDQKAFVWAKVLHLTPQPRLRVFLHRLAPYQPW